MKNIFTLAALFLMVVGTESASAQFPIKIPKITTGKPTVEKPKTETSEPVDTGQPEATTAMTQGGDFVEPQVARLPIREFRSVRLDGIKSIGRDKQR